ncbi:hypothetical protein [Achromobacter sp. Marseille-Q4962]|nr:hypothetical protein [Achromobacter sp. Marseille-Q4962]
MRSLLFSFPAVSAQAVRAWRALRCTLLSSQEAAARSAYARSKPG